ncbi:hypothetical protein NM688_g8583 [Phlebia brevispora]|uniref:Uncharacterized protein n=1 Tax=Phlebia brevispora TaxID=194682 RepID=A0ACC1RS05_9APHY|nr:hypothetical protein NM688_g8583 [Phlebia brevispora]
MFCLALLWTVRLPTPERIFMERFHCIDTPAFTLLMESVNALSFSPDGLVLAIALDNSQVLLYDHRASLLLHRLIGDSPITALMWHPTERYALFVGAGDGSCVLHQLAKDLLNQNLGDGLIVPLGLDNPGIIEGLDYDVSSKTLAVAAGSQVAITQSNTNYTVWTPLPLPARVVHFMDEGKSLIITYLNHGIVYFDIAHSEQRWHIASKTPLGRSALVRDHSLIVHNLSEGFDRYDLTSLQLVHTFPSPSTPSTNVPLPVLSLESDQLLFRSSIGEPKLSDESGQIVQTLQPPVPSIIQALAFCHVGNDKYIALGASESPPYLTIWKAELKQQLATPKLTGPTKEGRKETVVRPKYIAWTAVYLTAGLFILIIMSISFQADGICGRLCLLPSDGSGRGSSTTLTTDSSNQDVIVCFRACRRYTTYFDDYYAHWTSLTSATLGSLWVITWGFVFGFIKVLCSVV